MQRWTLVAVAAVAALASGCLGSSSSRSSGPTAAAPKYGDVVGVVVADEHRGKGLGGVPAELDPAPAAGMLVTGRTTAGAHVVRRFRTDTNGDFHLRLAPGRYVFAAKVPSRAAILRHTVLVRPGQMTTVWIAGYLPSVLRPIVI